MKATWLGEGDDIDIDRISAAAAAVNEIWNENRAKTDRDYVEGLAAPCLFNALQGVDTAVLDDPGFWRYLAVFHFWNFVCWRQSGAFKPDGKFMRSLDGVSSRNTVLTRMYLRVATAGGADYAEYAKRLTQATDFWQSHILNVRTASAPSLVRAMVAKQKDDRKKTLAIRQIAKDMTAVWTNVVLNIYDDDDAMELVDELWEAHS